MYFAFEKLSGTALEELIIAVSTQMAYSPGAPHYAYALVDCAFDENLLSHAGLKKLLRISLYEGTRLSGFGAASPFLIRLPDGGREKADSIKLLARLCSGRPMWSIIVAGISLDELKSHFEPFLLARCTDGLAWPVRWADSRVIRPLLNAIKEIYSKDLTDPFHAWLLPTRSGTVQILPGAAAQRPVLNYVEMYLTDSQINLIVEECEPDAVIAQISKTQPDILAKHAPGVLYDLVEQQLRQGSQIGLSAAPLRLHFSIFPLILNPGFEKHPEFLKFLENITKGAAYYDEIEKLSTEFWQAASLPNT
ncbi:DUF4123 domain-containing protein [Pseudoduganella plicata]|uniref:DUF4123 domain-containing protein n=1 Tax=Pseudoduganella plicata TaxID=321984 RepID=A0A4V1ATC2_9BURK|nr:DUF4123 domain-containing protein [Pseudoduganella plicata]QBQ35158.1 DUF4123 domain-containing protein [Pseudoduganella plicata]GGZ05396.1 hypothetical protein GCM10007388_43890 [Pseudoduganella plicata]